MKNFFYSSSDQLQQLLYTFEDLHKKVVLLPLSPKMEIKLQMEANINRMYHTLRLADIDTRRSRIVDILNHPKNIKRHERMALDMKRYFELFYYEYKFSNESIDTDFILNLIYDMEKRRITLNVREISNYIEYIQLEESPLIQSALAYLLFMQELNNPVSSNIATLAAWLFLFKKGYDFRRIISFQRQFMNDRIQYYEILERTKHQENITEWINYYCRAFVSGIETEIPFIQDQMQQPSLQKNILSKRHLEILALFSNPQEMITNRMLQKKFHISQITASRDLSYLTSVGLLFSLRKGRSTGYTKV